MNRLVGLMIGASLIAMVMAAAILRSPGEAAPAPPKPAQQTQAAVATAPKPATSTAVALAADASGHFVADVQINGIFVKGLVDTGATSVALPLDVARSVGINPRPEAFDATVMTANGETRGARVRLKEVRISTIVVRDVEAVVVGQGLQTPLIGMSFLRRITSEMRGATMVLRQ